MQLIHLSGPAVRFNISQDRKDRTMPPTNQSRSWWLPILIAFLVGILIGYFLRKPKPTKAYFNILPGGVQAAPNTGSQVEWLLNGQYSDNVYIHFLGESPCRPGTGDGHRCTIADGASGQYMYYCTDKAKPNDSTAKIL